MLLTSSFIYGQSCPGNSTVTLYQGGSAYTINVPDEETDYISGGPCAGQYATTYDFGIATSITGTPGYLGQSHNPTTVGTTTYYVRYRIRELLNPTSCTFQNLGPYNCGNTVTVNVVDFSWANFSIEACISSNTLDLNSLRSITSGVTYSGTGVTGSNFDASAAGLGSHTITATKVFPNGTASKTLTINVVAQPQADLSFIPSQECAGAPVTLSGSPTISQGGSLVSISLDGSNVSFDFPWSTTAGAHTIIYTVQNLTCGNVTTTKNVQIGTNYSITSNADYSLCEGGPLNLTSTTPPTVPGGITGTGSWSMVSSCAGCLSGATFTPPDIPSSGTQNYTIKYSFTGSGGSLGCNKEINKTITVKPKSDLSFANTSIQRCGSGILFLDTEFVPRANGSNVTPSSWSVGSLSSNYTAADRSLNAGSVVISGSQQTFPLSFTYTNSYSCTSTSGNANLILDKTPNAPANTNTAAELKSCGPGAFTLKATGAVSGESYIWRNEAGSQVSGSGNSYTTGTLNIGTYVYSVAIRGVNSCESQRTNVTITVNSNPSITSTVASLTKCTGSYNANLYTDYGISTGGSGTNNWSSTNSAVSSKLNATSGVLNLTGLSAATNIPITFKFTSTDGCQSTLSLTLNINSGVAQPVVDDVKNCEVGVASLTVTNVDVNATYNWYDASTGGNLLGTGTGYTTPSLTAPPNSSQSYSYFVSASSSSCTSSREEVVVTVVNTDQIVAGVDLSFCDNTGKISDLRGAASPAGGTFSGTGVTYVGVTPVFNCGSNCGLSLLPNNENYTITYSYTNTGCTYTDVRVISLGFKPVITVTPDVSTSPMEVKVGEFVKIEHNYTDATETTWTFVGEGTGAIGNPVGHIYMTEGYKSIDVTIKRAGCTGTFSAANAVLVEPDPFEIITGTEDPLETLRNSEVYPNPMTGALAIQTKADMTGVNFSLLNSIGNGIKSRQMNIIAGRNEIFDASIVNSLPSGVYFMRVGQGKSSYTLKLLKP